MTPDDRWKAARPEQSVMVRVRCRWDSTTQGLPKIQRVELLELFIDGQKVMPTLVAPKAKWGAYQDYYHAYHMARPAVGRHNATAVVRVLADQTETSHTIEFIV